MISLYVSDGLVRGRKIELSSRIMSVCEKINGLKFQPAK